jgi:hypothetical protein
MVLLCVLLAMGCGTGNRLDTEGDGPGGGQFLPVINQVDSGEIALANGAFDGAGNDLVLTDPASGASIRLLDGNSVSTAEQTYDPDGDGDLDFIVLVLRGLAAHAAANVTATKGGAPVSPSTFTKVAGATLAPLDATFSVGVTVSLPLSAFADAGVGSVLELYKFDDGAVYGHSFSDDIGTDTGVWEYVSDVTVETLASGGNGVSFTTNEFGHYCVVGQTIVHNEGSGGDI